MRGQMNFLVLAMPLAVLLVSSGVAAAPITFNTALPVSKDELIYRQQAIVTRASGEANGPSRDVSETRGVSVLGYGVSPKLAVFGVLPVVHRASRTGTVERSAFGLGDAALFARYEIFRKDGPGRTVRLAPFAGFTVPTGERGSTGDGSFDGFGGLILTVATTSWVFDSQIKYTVNTEADDFKRGDEASADASVQYRLFPGRLSADGRRFLFAVLEANVTHLEKDRLFGVEDPDSGGLLMFLSPGLQFAAKRWIAEVALRIPVAGDLNGAALEPEYSIITSLRFNF